MTQWTTEIIREKNVVRVEDSWDGGTSGVAWASVGRVTPEEALEWAFEMIRCATIAKARNARPMKVDTHTYAGGE